MLRSNFAEAAGGQGLRLTAVLEGVRPAQLHTPGLFVRARTQELRVGVALLADPLVILVIGGAQQAMHWSLMPGGPSVTARADGLRFLRSLATGGRLTFAGGGLQLPPIEFDGGPWKDEDEWRLFEDLAVLEEWTGATLKMPTIVSAGEATLAAQAASWARTQLVEASISDAISFQAGNGGHELPDELRLHQTFSVRILGEDLTIGEGVARIKLLEVKREDDVETRKPARYEARPVDSELTFWLAPPATRRTPPRRTQSDQISPPGAGVALDGRLIRSPLLRPARRQLAQILPNRRTFSVRHRQGTAGLIDDLRG